MNTTTPADFMAHYFGHQRSFITVQTFAAKIRGQLPIFEHCERYSGQERLDAWAETQALGLARLSPTNRWTIKIDPVTTDFDALLAFLDAEIADGDTEDIA